MTTEPDPKLDDLVCYTKSKWREAVRSARWLFDILLIAVMCANTFFVINLMQQIKESEFFQVRPVDVLMQVEEVKMKQLEGSEQFFDIKEMLEVNTTKLIENADQLEANADRLERLKAE